MKRLVTAALLLALPAVAAEQRPPRDRRPVALSDAQLDRVSGGDLFGDLFNIANVGTLDLGTVSNLIGDVQGLVANADQLRAAFQGLQPQQFQIIIGHAPGQ